MSRSEARKRRAAIRRLGKVSGGQGLRLWQEANEARIKSGEISQMEVCETALWFLEEYQAGRLVDPLNPGKLDPAVRASYGTDEDFKSALAAAELYTGPTRGSA